MKWRERRDSNPQPPDRQSGTLTKLSYAPTSLVSELRIIESRPRFASKKSHDFQLGQILDIHGAHDAVFGINDEQIINVMILEEFEHING